MTIRKTSAISHANHAFPINGSEKKKNRQGIISVSFVYNPIKKIAVAKALKMKFLFPINQEAVLYEDLIAGNIKMSVGSDKIEIVRYLFDEVYMVLEEMKYDQNNIYKTRLQKLSMRGNMWGVPIVAGADYVLTENCPWLTVTHNDIYNIFMQSTINELENQIENRENINEWTFKSFEIIRYMIKRKELLNNIHFVSKVINAFDGILRKNRFEIEAGKGNRLRILEDAKTIFKKLCEAINQEKGRLIKYRDILQYLHDLLMKPSEY